MAFTDQQARQLKAKLDAQYVKTRRANGITLHYIEGWHVIAEANRIFGYDGWDRRTRALYDREQAGVRQRSPSKPNPETNVINGPWMIRSATGDTRGSFGKPADFIQALRETMTKAQDIESLFAVWEQNVATVRELNAHKQKAGLAPGFAQDLVAHLKACAVALVKSSDGVKQTSADAVPAQSINPTWRSKERPKIDKSALTIGEVKRIRSKDHLRFVARQPCLICGRIPSQAHHIRYGQPKGLALKVSDEFTVPLCAIHHSENHATGDERRWWNQHKIDPLLVADALWRLGRMPRLAERSMQGEEATPKKDGEVTNE